MWPPSGRFKDSISADNAEGSTVHWRDVGHSGERTGKEACDGRRQPRGR
jgi:hypothetical protein